ncbi:DUF349 domain-containing protein [Alteromonas gilva]|uniref:DUF349 domain-containing protein n=1 Tax=Alteromonas gilva TaxID=2987522 RepID=A0ABT5L1G9_9ALTE|nr:DUF349 domain-containing protein [Alteromonas gilva]MDC8830880.1 DUF349 domain-containing protein [Alteromonas gilva]
MIFSRFFSPAHSSDDPNIRIKAIANLSPDSANERRILHELAFNDADAKVSLAALDKLDSFVLWLKMSQIARDPALVSAAQLKVESALIDGTSEISQAEVKEYMLKAAPVELVVRCLPRMTALHADTDFCGKVLVKVGRSSFYQQLLMETPVFALKSHIIENSHDTDLLQRVLRKSDDESLQALLNKRIAMLAEAAQKPITLARQVTLVLSKLLALLDKSDYQQIYQAQQSLNQEYAELSNDFACLDAETRGEFANKLANINQRIDKLLQRLRPDWEAEQHAAAHARARASAEQAVAEVKRHQKQLHGEQILSLTLGEVTQFQQAVEQAEKALADLQKFEPATDEFESMLETYRHIWDRLPDLQRQVEQARQQLMVWQALIESSDTDWQIEDIRSQWQEITQSMALVPAFLRDQWQQLFAQFKRQDQHRRAEQQRELKHCRKHINIINQLVEQGRFRAAMGRYQRLETDYNKLPDQTRAMLEKRFEQTREQIARLEGWQIYLAAPRKPELLEQASALLSEQHNDMPARARSIKYLRQQWQSLGETNTPEDTALNKQFDDILEQAFEPCRAYYAKLEEQNNQAAQARQQLVDTLQALAVDTDIAPEQRYQQFETLKKQWLKAAQTDSERYQRLRQDWDKHSAVVTELLNPWLLQNRQAKQALINEVNALAEFDNAAEARQRAKTLQANWKNIGPAGKRNESKLWMAFKAANDALFNKAKSVQAEQKAAQNQAAEGWRASLADIQNSMAAGQLDEASQQLARSRQAIADFTDNGLQNVLQRELEAYQLRLNKAKKQQAAEQIERAIAALAEHMVSTPSAASLTAMSKQFSELPSLWFKAQQAEQTGDWLNTLITLEVLGQIESPEQDASKRSTIQLQLMQAKLSGEALPEPDHLIAKLVAGVCDTDAADLAMYQSRFTAVLTHFSRQEVR